MNIGFLEKVYLRGLEGIVGDKFLAKVSDPHSHDLEGVSDFFEAKYIAIQIFFKMKGWGW